jgi:DNA-binding winged helix-turn-helix (wHTH) protein
MMVENPIIYEFDGIRVDPLEFRVLKAESALQIEPKAFQVLVFLLENRGRLVEKRELLDSVWKETFVTENALTREIAQLRKALGENAREAKYIQTVPTKGYRFIADVQICSARELTGQISPTVLKGDHFAVEPAASPIQVTKVSERDSRVGHYIQRPAEFIYLGAILALVLAGGVFIWHTYRRSDFKTRIVRGNKQVTAWIGLDINPSLSPDGSSVAYSSNHDGNFEIFVKPLASGGREIQITSDGGQNFEPAWSPNGRYIAYHSRDRGGIWVTPALGGPSHQLTRFGSSPAWSPDGANIVFQEQAYTDISSVALGAIPPSSIWTVPTAGGEARPITRSGSPSGGHSAPSWSPDGKRIVFVANDTSFREIWSASAAGGDLKRLTTNNESYFDPIYAPDGESIYCGGIAKNNTYGLWRIRITPGSGERVGEAVEVQSTGTQPIRNLSISANG